jgi:hypothetical protein
MDELIADLRSPQSTADLAALDLAPLFAAMATAQTDFEGIAADKAATEGGETLPSIAEHRPLLERYLNLLIGNIAVWQDVGPTAAVTDAINQIEEVITTITAPVVARRTRSQSEQEPENPAP